MPLASVSNTLPLDHGHPQGDLAAQDLPRTTDAVEALEQVHKEVLAILVHDLRNPLYAISAYSELLAKEEFGPLTAAQSNLLRRLRHCTQELERLLTAVLPPAAAR